MVHADKPTGIFSRGGGGGGGSSGQVHPEYKDGGSPDVPYNKQAEYHLCSPLQEIQRIMNLCTPKSIQLFG